MFCKKFCLILFAIVLTKASSSSREGYQLVPVDSFASRSNATSDSTEPNLVLDSSQKKALEIKQFKIIIHNLYRNGAAEKEVEELGQFIRGCSLSESERQNVFDNFKQEMGPNSLDQGLIRCGACCLSTAYSVNQLPDSLETSKIFSFISAFTATFVFALSGGVKCRIANKLRQIQKILQKQKRDNAAVS